MKVLVTGSNGLLGQYLIQRLSALPGYEVVATGRGPNRLKMQDGYVYESVNLGDEAGVKGLVERHRPDAIIHAGAMTQADDCERNKDACWMANVTATRYLLQGAERTGSFFLFLSTDFVFDGLGGPYREDDPVNPVNYYGASKAAAERIVKQAKVPWAIARTVLVYGLADDPRRSNIITWVKNNLEQKKKLKVVNDQWRTPTFVQDLAEGCRLIIDKRAQGVFHLSGKDMLTPYDMAVQVAHYLNLDTRLFEKVDATSFKQPAKRPAKTGFIIEKAEKELGYSPHSFEEGLKAILGEGPAPKENGA
ncbi:NAD(P)-dependent oxidoreductase [Chitinophaga alhagiae]|uniref:dTDP-4-dehydrorhamnose reductase n=1 Tax=Chitinophaga alhagiae TaxID=2203219 RepID=A0ABM6W8I1_9BACT|nr:NAD(P)-dependent oxidoreductase [Chitinophaga alhagiae]AWO00251.1 NAD(P)-dependent oxidoreductase [Chitinophaga alhagiae]